MGRNGGRFLEKALRRRIETCKSKYSTAEEIANHLRSTYSVYRRTKNQTLIRFVQEALHSTAKPKHTPKPEYSDGDDDSNRESRSASRKRGKKIDEGEEKSKKMKVLHVRRRVQNLSASSCTSSESDDEETVSTSEDAIYGEKVAPPFDFTKEVLRKSYTPKKVVAAAAEERKQSLRSVSNGEILNDLVRRKDGLGFKNLGGMKEVLEELKKNVIRPLFHPQILKHLRVKPTGGILLHGPPGCGKTHLAEAIANESGLPFYKISSTELVYGVSGVSEQNIRELFDKAHRTAPSVIFIDEIDAISPKREDSQREMEKRIVTQLITCMDQSNSAGYVLVIGATNRPDAIDPALRRPGRFDLEIMICHPDESAREEILCVLTSDVRLEGLFDLHKIAQITSGFVGADLINLVNEAGKVAMDREFEEIRHELMSKHGEEWWKEPWSAEEIDKTAIKMSDFEKAYKKVLPSLKREGFSIIPNVKWEDIGGLDVLRKELEEHILWQIKYPDECEALGLKLDPGFLLYGPPGCGKTLIAKAVAGEAGVSFIHIKGPELLNKYVGECELAIRTLFSRARTCAPCIVFFDEVDALTTERGKEGGSVNRPLLQLLSELDGVGHRRGVFVIGATNRPEMMDPALLRPGRFGKLVYVPLPGLEERALILKALARTMTTDATVDLSAIAGMGGCENLSGADLSKLMQEAAMAAMREKDKTIKSHHFEIALSKVSPSVSERQRQYYQHLSERFK